MIRLGLRRVSWDFNPHGFCQPDLSAGVAGPKCHMPDGTLVGRGEKSDLEGERQRERDTHTCLLKSKMNDTISTNKTSFPAFTCTDSFPGNIIGISVTIFQMFVLLPIQSWVLWLSTAALKKRRRLPGSEIFTVSLALSEMCNVFFFISSIIAYALHFQYTVLLLMFFSGSYMVGRPFMNSLFCVERYIAVAHPVIYLNPAFMKYRYIAAGIVWILIFTYGAFFLKSFPEPPIEAYLTSLSFSLSVITACSLGVLKVLLRPSPGEAQKEGMHRQKKRAFVIITGVLVCISVAYGMDLLVFSIKKYISYDSFCVALGINLWIIQQSSLIQPFLYLFKLSKLLCIEKVFH
ncbi:uncharacterized protein [Danio rerio]|uniref:Uncharacterized protein n=1 Tax=Danio rerio TaxID=7955 RepID=A0AC58G3R7_DANRE